MLGQVIYHHIQIQGLEEVTSKNTYHWRSCCFHWNHASSPHILQFPATTAFMVDSIHPDQELCVRKYLRKCLKCHLLSEAFFVDQVPVSRLLFFLPNLLFSITLNTMFFNLSTKQSCLLSVVPHWTVNSMRARVISVLFCLLLHHLDL